MATFIDYSGNGSQTDYVFPFAHDIDAAHVIVTLNGVATTAFTLLSEYTVRFNVAPLNGVKIRIARLTDPDPPITWSDGAVMLGRNLNASAKHTRFIAEEARDVAVDASAAIIGSVEDAVAEAQAVKAAVEATAATIVGDAAEAAQEVVQGALSTIESAETNAVNAASSASNDAAAVAVALGTIAASVAAAVSAYDNFDDRFLGSKSSDPTVDNDGAALQIGALYFNSTIEKMKIWTGAAWQLAFNDVAAASAISNDSSVPGATVAAAINALADQLGDKADASALAGKANTSHTHAQSDITGLTSALAAKADASALAGKETLGEVAAINTQTGTTYTFVLGDKGQTVEGSNAAATAFTIPPNSSVAFPVKTYINVVQMGVGQITLTAGAGVTLRSRNGLKLAGLYAMATLYKRGTNEWVVGGDVAA